MNIRNLAIAAGIISILLLAGCGVSTIKEGQNNPQKETISEGESGEDISEDSSARESTDSGSSIQPTENPETSCSTLNPHPMAEGMAEQFKISYDEIMTWYCNGAAFSDILLALETVDLVDIPVEELLEMVEDKTWEEIWNELGVDPNN